MLWPKKDSYEEFDNEKKFLRPKSSPPDPDPDPSCSFQAFFKYFLPYFTYFLPYQQVEKC